MNPRALRLLASAVFCLIAHLGFAPSSAAEATPCPTPTPPKPCPSASPFPPCPLGMGWAEGLVQYTKYPAPKFPTSETQSLCAVDCNFHQWSWEAFVWATAIGPDGRARFTTLGNIDDIAKPKKTAAATKGPKPLGLKPRDLKPKTTRQNSGDTPQQAGGGIVVDRNGQIIWYSTHMNDLYFRFVQKYGGTGYANAPATLNFPVGAAVFKASWQVVPDGTTPEGFYTEKTTVPMLVNNPCGGIMVDPLGKTRSVTVALVGLHVVGVTENHPEFLWATFEHERNAPDLPPNMAPDSADSVSSENFNFYTAGTAARACNVNDVKSLQVTDPAKQTVGPATNVFRQFAYGGATPEGRVTDIQNINKAAQTEMTNMVKLKPTPPQKPIPALEAIWANYRLIGTLWIAQPGTLKPNMGNLEVCGVGSVNLANSTLETYFQNPKNDFLKNNLSNCFMCHNTGTYDNLPGKNMTLSHTLMDTVPQPSATPTPTCTPVASTTPAQ